MNTKGSMKNLNNTAYLLAFFTIVWAASMLVWFILDDVLPVGATIVLSVIFLAIAGYIYISAVLGYRSLKPIPEDDGSIQDKLKSKRWSVVFALQAVAISLSGALLGSFKLHVFIAPVMLLIVGLHYIPISMLYHTTIQSFVAIPTILIALLGLLAIFTDTGSRYAAGVCSLVGAIGCVTLGIWATTTVRAFVRQASSEVKADKPQT
jgi:hypothetical protein